LLVLLQGNCPKHVEFYSKNKFQKLVHLVGFVTEELYETCRVLFQKNKFEKLVHPVSFITGELSETCRV